MSSILKVENISKQYRLGLVGTGTLSHDVNRWWHKIRGKEDPYLKLGDVNDRSTKSESNYVWALRNISFNVEKGEVLGVIGKNGAGKSTLLKILSRVTMPTTGQIKTKGRIASLLEVGTGFHPELTGRENIYLNGAILGMTKSEIRKKEYEIISFSGCERYIDTPVKRYSSGMRVRLAFAVAAFLEPDILVIDEVLAVGDAEFQKKAIGKMQDISRGDGRTVLFVSHNMAAVRDLCTRAMVLQNGLVAFEGDTDAAVDFYLNYESHSLEKHGLYRNESVDSNRNNQFVLDTVALLNTKNKETTVFSSLEPITIKTSYMLKQKLSDLRINFNILTRDDIVVFTASSHNSDKTDKSKGHYEAVVTLPGHFFNKGLFKVVISAGIPNVEVLLKPKTIMQFEIKKTDNSNTSAHDEFPGIMAPILKWNVHKNQG